MSGNNLMFQLAVAEGFCCVYAYYSYQRDEGRGTKQIAARLGIDERSVRKWKHQIREGTCCCESQSNCQRGKSWVK